MADMALYYLKALVDDGRPPENMVDANIKTDYEKLKIIADIQRRQCGDGGSVAAQNADATADGAQNATATADRAVSAVEGVLPVTEQLAQDYAETTPVRGGLQGEIRVQGYMQAEFGHLKFYLLAPECAPCSSFSLCLHPPPPPSHALSLVLALVKPQ